MDGTQRLTVPDCRMLKPPTGKALRRVRRGRVRTEGGGGEEEEERRRKNSGR
jgi:hypothetical protein